MPRLGPVRVSEGSTSLLSAVLGTSAAIALADSLARSYFDATSLAMHWGLVFSLIIPPALALGVVFAAGTHVFVALRNRYPQRWAFVGLFVAIAVLAACGVSGALKASLSGVFSRSPVTAYWIWITGSVCLGTAASAWCWGVARAVSSVKRERSARALRMGALGLALGALFMFSDLTILVALYASLHRLAEAAAWLCFTSGVALMLWLGQRRWVRLSGALTVLLIGAAVWSLYFSSSSAARARHAERLRYVWREPLYAARMALRVQLIADYLRDPAGWSGALDSRISRLERQYDISTTALSTVWDLPRPQAPSTASRPPLNVVVFFVDTLRADVANNSTWMPHLAAFKKQSLDFTQAFSAASDTVSVLPVLTGGCYGSVPCADDSLRVMRSRGVKTGLFLARSANQFLSKLSPHFSFETVEEVPDYAEDKPVWGYGADGPTSKQVVANTLRWIEAQRERPFLAWAFNFDVHNWMHLDDAYLRKIAGEVGLDTQSETNQWRYKSAAVGIDRAFGDLLAGLTRLGLDKNTAVLLVSDHGEALGQRRHAYHAVFLWDTLVHVPLVLRVPGEAPRQVAGPVGHVDVAPTLLSLLLPTEGGLSFHGVSLLDDQARKEALPLLLQAMRKEELMRVALIERQAPVFKLELPLDSAEPELFEFLAQGDEKDVSRQYNSRVLTMLSQLVTSPVFPRTEAAAPH